MSRLSTSTASAAEHVYDAIIIGGGISGMSAAAYLHSHSTPNFLVLEARSRLGGRTHTITTADGYKVDLGGAYVGPTQNRILRVAHSLGVKTTLTYDSDVTHTKNILVGPNQRSEYHGIIPNVSPFALLDMNHALQQTERLRLQIDRLQPHLPPRSMLQADTITMEQWITSTCTSPLACELYRAAVRGLSCVEPCEVSVQWWMSFVQSGYGADIILGVKGGAQERHFVGGSQQISEKLAERIGQDEHVQFNKAVQSIDWNTDKTAASATETSDPTAHTTAASTVLITCRDGSRYRARRVIVAVSPALYSSMSFTPYFPLVKQPATRMYMGSIIKTVMRYSTPWWREKNYSGLMMQLTDSVDESDCDEMPPPVGYTYDDCHEEQVEGAQPFYAVMGFVSAHQFTHISNQTPQLSSTHTH